jgi:2-polyprenyl-6-methoxyphenol hydroxylase-like FAD-dependent oxidoreductase
MDGTTRVLIVGAGIAGLTLANALNRKGIRPLIVEVSSNLRPPGLGLSLQPNGVRALGHLDLAEAVAAGGRVGRQMVTANAAEEPIRTMDLTVAGTTLAVHRDALIGPLSASLDADLRLETTVVAVEPSGEGASVTLSDGSTVDVDLVVGADGLHSALRGQLFPDATLEYRNYRAWRTVVPRRDEDPPEAMRRWSAGVAFGTFPVSDELLYIFVLEHGPDDEPSAVDYAGHIHRVARQFGPTARSAAGRVDESTPTVYTPVYRVRLDRWTRGPVVLIGDAAHAIVPMLAQGAALAIEDAVLLAEAVADSPTPVVATAAYEDARRPRLETAAEICGFASLASGIEGPADRDALQNHPGNPARFGGDAAAAQAFLWEGIDAQLARR